MTVSDSTGGRERSLCGARTRQGGSCRRPAGWGTDHPLWGRCKLHAGATPTGSRAAHRQAAEFKAHALLAAEGLEPVTDPVAVMSLLAAEAVALVSALRTMVADLDGLRYQGGASEQLRAEVSLYERALDRAEKFANNLARLGLEERVVKVTEAQAGTLATMVTAVLEGPELALSVEQVSSARRMLAERAREMAGAA